jgi:hypothetical protein
MAKNSGKTPGTSRIKFIMFDAEIADDQIDGHAGDHQRIARASSGAGNEAPASCASLRTSAR